MAAPAFDAVQNMVNLGVTQHLSNATVQRTAGGPALAASYALEQPDGSPFVEVATVAQHVISMWLAGFDDLAEGEVIILTTSRWPGGKTFRISAPVQPDVSGWASFTVVPMAPVTP